MSRFVRTQDGGWINLDHVSRIEPQHGGNYMLTVNGEEVSVQTEYLDSVLENVKHVPAAPGWCLVWHLDDGTVIGSSPIIAWEVPSGKFVLLNGKNWLIGPSFWKEHKLVSPMGAVFGDPSEAADTWTNWNELRADMLRHPEYWKTGGEKTK